MTTLLLVFALQSFLARAPKAQPAAAAVSVQKIPLTFQLTADHTTATQGTVVGITAHLIIPSGLPTSIPKPTGMLCINVSSTSTTNPSLSNCGLTPVTDESWFTPLLPVGVNTITATYAGDANYAGTTSTTSLRVSITTTGLTVNTQAPPPATLGIAYSYTVPVSGGTPPYSCTITGLPAGLSGTTSGNTAGCPITGTPTTTTPAAVVVPLTVKDSATPTANTTTVNIDPEVLQAKRHRKHARRRFSVQGIGISGVNPTSGNDGAKLTLTISGSGFVPTMSGYFTCPGAAFGAGTQYPFASVTYVSPTQVTAVQPTIGLAAGAASVVCDLTLSAP